MKEEEYQLRRDVDQKRDAVLQKMDSVLSQAKDFEQQMYSFLSDFTFFFIVLGWKYVNAKIH